MFFDSPQGPLYSSASLPLLRVGVLNCIYLCEIYKSLFHLQFEGAEHGWRLPKRA